MSHGVEPRKCPKGRRALALALALAIRRFSCMRPFGAIVAGWWAGGPAQCRTMIPALTGVPRMAILAAMNSRRTLPIVLLASLLLAGCAERNLLVGYEKDENFLSFNHSFTDAAAADVRARAERLCGLRKQAVIQTSRTCSLTQCTTNYQCIDAVDAAKYGR